MFRFPSVLGVTIATFVMISYVGLPIAQASEKSVESNKNIEELIETSKTQINAPYNEFLSKYVSRHDGINLVAYGDVSDEDEAMLEAYIDKLSNLDISNYDDDAIMAYWFNLYNAKTIDVILDNYPVKSIRKIGFTGPWKKKVLTVNGKAMSLNNIEHDTIRANYDEPRIHFAFNCASIGCPNLKLTAWEKETLEADLTQAAKDFVNSSRGVDVTASGKLIGSSLFKWYKDDFGASEAEVINYLSQFAEGDIKIALENARKFDKFDYDWNLNIAK